MKSDVKATRLASSGAVFGGPGRIKSVWAVGGSGAGTLTLKDGGSSGTTVAVIDIPAGVGGGHDIMLPGDGIRCSSDIYATIASFTAVTVFYA
jgi:hypothetical protein